MKTEKEIEAAIKAITDDERFHYPTALVDVNAPLALIQAGMESKVAALAWVLGIPTPQKKARAKAKST